MTDQDKKAQIGDVHFRYAESTHVGLVREANEDNLVVIPDAGVFVVADGMGGHAAGRTASDICIDTITSFFAEGEREEALAVEAESDDGQSLNPESVALARAILLANQRIFEASSVDAALHGMGTTVVGLRFFDRLVSVSHAGDSRGYLMRNHELVQITADHSLSNFLYELGRAQEAALAEATMSNVIMRALGLEANVSVDTREISIALGDVFLLCSDGLSDLVSLDTMESIVADSSMSLTERVERLVELALDAGGRDNISVILVRVEDIEGIRTDGGSGEPWDDDIPDTDPDRKTDPDQKTDPDRETDPDQDTDPERDTDSDQIADTQDAAEPEDSDVIETDPVITTLSAANLDELEAARAAREAVSAASDTLDEEMDEESQSTASASSPDAGAEPADEGEASADQSDDDSSDEPDERA